MPPTLACNILDLHGERGRQWLTGLPDRLRSVADRWAVTLEAPFSSASYSFVVPGALPGGQEVVIKVCFPEPAFEWEAVALRHYGGTGAVRLIEFDRENGALMIERCQPGDQLSTVNSEEEAISAAARVILALQKAPQRGSSFPSIKDWSRGFKRLRQRFNGGSGPIPEAVLSRAEAIYEEWSRPTPADIVLHGDLHHGNILAGERQPWLAIDPKGVIGPPDYEVGAFLRNPVPQILEKPGLSRVLARRIDRFAEILEFDRERLIGWGVAQAVLSACWDLEDHDRGGDRWISLAQTILTLP